MRHEKRVAPLNKKPIAKLINKVPSNDLLAILAIPTAEFIAAQNISIRNWHIAEARAKFEKNQTAFEAFTDNQAASAQDNMQNLLDANCDPFNNTRHPDIAGLPEQREIASAKTDEEVKRVYKFIKNYSDSVDNTDKVNVALAAACKNLQYRYTGQLFKAFKGIHKERKNDSKLHKTFYGLTAGASGQYTESTSRTLSHVP